MSGCQAKKLRGPAGSTKFPWLSPALETYNLGQARLLWFEAWPGGGIYIYLAQMLITEGRRDR